MSNVNNYAMAKQMDQFKLKVLDPQLQRTREAEVIMHDANRKWDSEEQKKQAQAKYDSYKAWTAFYQKHYDEGMNLVTQHENLVNKLSKWYDCWYENISNDGKQESEMMNAQADLLNEIFVDIYKELQPLGLKDMKAPKALNL
ncbi:MAG: hypothetical protein ABSA76_01230 [Bacteroidales bacterium]